MNDNENTEELVALEEWRQATSRCRDMLPFAASGLRDGATSVLHGIELAIEQRIAYEARSL